MTEITRELLEEHVQRYERDLELLQKQASQIYGALAEARALLALLDGETGEVEAGSEGEAE